MINIHTYDTSGQSKQDIKQILMENLANYLNKPCSHIKINTNKNGKPFTDGLFFSISHCRNKLIQVFSTDGDGEVGIDIEYKNSKRNYLKLAKRYFHINEYEHMQSLAKHEAIVLFYKLWTTKEAYCKYRGGTLWHFLEDNFLDDENTIVNKRKEVYLKEFNLYTNYAMSLATTTFSTSEIIKHD